MKSALTNATKAMFVLLSGIALVACSDAGAEDGDNPLGSASQSVEEGVRLTMINDVSQDDVTGFYIYIEHGEDPDEKFVVSDCVPLEAETLPSAFLIDGAGDDHRFADKFFVLAPDKDEYKIKATPVKSCSPLVTSDDCSVATGTALIEPGKTTEVVLMSYCDMPDSGAVDIIAGLQHDPTITGLEYGTSKFILTCEHLEIAVQAEDQDGDDLSYQWEVSGDPNAQYETQNMDTASMRFLSKTPGTYAGTVTVCDVYDSCASLTFPIYVQMSSDANNNGVGDDCEDQQTPDPDAGANSD